VYHPKSFDDAVLLVWSIFTPLAVETKAINLGQGFMKYVIFHMLSITLDTVANAFSASILQILFRKPPIKLFMMLDPTSTGIDDAR
jgi:hypothetical protein